MSKTDDFAQDAGERSPAGPEDVAYSAATARMAREVKIGVALLGVLLIIFGLVLFARLRGSEDESTATAGEPASASTATRAQSGPGTSPSAGAPVIAAQPGPAEPLDAAPELIPSGWTTASDDPGPRVEQASAPPQLSYMPAQAPVPPPSEPAAGGSAQFGPVAEGQSAAGGIPAPGPAGPSVAAGPDPGPSLNPVEGDANSPLDAAQNPLRAEPAAPAEPAAAAQVTADGPIQADPPPVAVSAGPEPAFQASAASEPGGPYATFKAPDQAAPPGPIQQAARYGSPEPGLAPTAQAAPLDEDGRYIVQPNDNYWLISKKVYRTGAFYAALAEHNRTEHPNPARLDLGDRVIVPPVEELEKRYPDLCPKREHRLAAQQRQSLVQTAAHRAGGRVYIVQEGDTLYDIARHELGQASRYGEIIQWNRDVLGGQYHYLTPGMELILPDEEHSQPTQVTQRPDTTHPR